MFSRTSLTNYSLVPVPSMMKAVFDYVEFGEPPGSFLAAVFSNDLMGSFTTVPDEENLIAMRDWVQFCYGEMPAKSHGSREAVNSWMKHYGISGLST